MDQETDLRKAVSKAKKAFWRKKDGKSKFLTRKEYRKKIRLNRKARKAGGTHQTDVAQQREKTTQGVHDNKSIKMKRKKKKASKKKEASQDKMETLSTAIDQENQVISTMEKRLKLKRKKNLPSVFTADGLDYLLEVCESFMDNDDATQNIEVDQDDTAFISDGDSPTVKKKPKLDDNETETLVSAESEDEFSSDSGTASDTECETDLVKSDDHTLSQSTNDNNERAEGDKKGDVVHKESIIVDAGGTLGDMETKYVPPQLRKASEESAKRNIVLTRMRKLVKGNLNRLSESNLHNICKEMEEVYSSNSKNDVNEILCQLILDACITPNLMPERLLMEHVMLIAVLNEVIGNEVGAMFLQKLADKFHHLHSMGLYLGEEKQCHNTILLLAHMYNFKVIDALLIFDIAQELLLKFVEQDIEMLLVILKTVGAEIRRDDPGSLKSLILDIQARAASCSAGADQSRVRFMLEIITALRNNNLRKIPQYNPDIVNHARKVIRQILKGKEGSNQLRISYKDLLLAKEKGRWWIVGSAWKGEEANEIESEKQSLSTVAYGDNLLSLAKQQRMTTDVKKTVFCVLMSSEDCSDAFEKLLKLNLKEKQAREIVHVVVDCCLQEKTYNAFYAFLGEKLCKFDKSHKITFQYTFWDRFKMLSTMRKSCRHNLASLLSHLLATHSISLSVLKVVSFGTIDKDSINFFKDVMSLLITKNTPRTIRSVFQRVASQQKLHLLREGLKVFLEFFLLPRKGTNTDASLTDERDRELVEEAISALDEVYVP